MVKGTQHGLSCDNIFDISTCLDSTLSLVFGHQHSFHSHTNCCSTRTQRYGLGGAICQESDNGNNGSLQLRHCTFADNAAMYGGGAVCAIGLTNGQVENCTFLNNSAQHGGAVYTVGGPSVPFIVQQCIFKWNRVSITGGALFLNATAIISHCQLLENVGPAGGTIYFMGKYFTLYITQSKISKSNLGGKGSIYGAAVFGLYARNIVANFVVFDDNNFGGMVLHMTRGEVHNSSFSNNTNGAISTHRTDVLIITNTSFVENGGDYSDPDLRLGTKNTVIHNCKFVVSGLVHLQAIQIKTLFMYSMILRSCGSVFNITQGQTQQELNTLISLFSNSPSVSSATLYFWDTWYQVNNSKRQPVDNAFIQNINTDGLTTGDLINVTAEFSQFASGKLHFKKTG